MFESNSVLFAVFKAANVVRVFDDRALHAEANAEIRNLLFARKLNGANHSGIPRLPNPPGTRIPSNWRSFAGSLRLRDSSASIQWIFVLQIVNEAAMDERFAQALVGVFQLDVLADDADGHFVDRVVDSFDERLPILHAPFGLRQMQLANDLVVETFRGKTSGTS